MGSTGTNKISYIMVADYDGGTYITEIFATSVREAIFEWAKKNSLGFPQEELESEIVESSIVPIKDAKEMISDCFCCSALIDDKLLLLNVISR